VVVGASDIIWSAGEGARAELRRESGGLEDF